jgi:hypothetical protein
VLCVIAGRSKAWKEGYKKFERENISEVVNERILLKLIDNLPKSRIVLVIGRLSPAAK